MKTTPSKNSLASKRGSAKTSKPVKKFTKKSLHLKVDGKAIHKKRPSHPTSKKKGTNKGRPSTGRSAAMDIVGAVLDQHITLEEARNAHLSKLHSVKDKKLAAMIANSVFRFYGPLSRMINHCLEKPFDNLEPQARNALLAGVTQLFYMSIPDHAAVDETVNLAPDSHRKLVNAIMRRLQREADELRLQYETPKQFLPKWLYERLLADYGKDMANSIALAHITTPPMDLTVFKEENVPFGDVLPGGSVRVPSGDPRALTGFQAGCWQVQDVAASIPVKLLSDINGKVIFDLCAAPGGKTAQLCAGGAEVYAVDHNEDRLQRLASNMERLNFTPQIIHSDVLECAPDFKADIVLLDAPCSATGTLRRHPELCWRPQRQLAIPELLEIQQAMLAHSIKLLKSGGTLVYAVCSLLKEEGEHQIAKFLEANPEMQRQNLSNLQTQNLFEEFLTLEGDIRTLPHYWKDKTTVKSGADGNCGGGMDGFYIAVLTKGSVAERS